MSYLYQLGFYSLFNWCGLGWFGWGCSHLFSHLLNSAGLPKFRENFFMKYFPIAIIIIINSQKLWASSHSMNSYNLSRVNSMLNELWRSIIIKPKCFFAGYLHNISNFKLKRCYLAGVLPYCFFDLWTSNNTLYIYNFKFTHIILNKTTTNGKI